MAAWQGPLGPREPKRLDAGDEWCDSGLGSLGEEGQIQEEARGLVFQGDGGGGVTSPAEPLKKSLPPEDEGAERLDSALGDSLGADQEEEEEEEAVVSGIGAVRLESGQAVGPEAWLRHVLAFVTEDGDT